MMAHRVVAVSISLLGVQHGLWCATCALSTGATVWYVVGGSLRSKSECADCGGSDVVPDARAEWLA